MTPRGARCGNSRGGPPLNLTAMTEGELPRIERLICRRGLLPAYATDFLRHSRPRENILLLRSGRLPQLPALRLLGRRGT